LDHAKAPLERDEEALADEPLDVVVELEKHHAEEADGLAEQLLPIGIVEHVIHPWSKNFHKLWNPCLQCRLCGCENGVGTAETAPRQRHPKFDDLD
jgi:hypothetical protein